MTLVPFIADGKLQARLGSFALSDRKGVSKYLPLQFVVQRILTQELKKLNENRKFYRAPSPFFEQGFVYSSIQGEKFDDGERVVITAIYKAENPDLDQLTSALRADGLTQ